MASQYRSLQTRKYRAIIKKKDDPNMSIVRQKRTESDDNFSVRLPNPNTNRI